MAIELNDIWEAIKCSRETCKVALREYAISRNIKDMEFVDALLNALGEISVDEAIQAIEIEAFEQNTKWK